VRKRRHRRYEIICDQNHDLRSGPTSVTTSFEQTLDNRRNRRLRA
jgi:hypothetical protein